MITVLAWLMIIVFMVLIMKKKMHPFAAIVSIPLLFTIIGVFFGLYKEAAATAYKMAASDVTFGDQFKLLGDWIVQGLTKVSPTAFMLFFAILFFSLMLDVGLFDPITKLVIRLAKGDPVKVLVGTGIISAIVSLSGDGTTTTLICCTALIPIYKKLNLKMMNLGVILILMNTILNLLPWSGPTARVISVLEGINANEILLALVPGMAIAILYVLGVSYYLGLKERKRLGIQHLSDEDIELLIAQNATEQKAQISTKQTIANTVLTIGAMFFLISGTFEPVFIFLVATVLALVINYRTVNEQKQKIQDSAADVLQTVIMIVGAGVFMGLFSYSGMSDALASSLVHIIPQSFGRYWCLITTLISAPGGFFLSNDGFFYGVLPVLAQTGVQYGFTSFQIGFASLLGQAFHMLSPLTAFIYLLLSMTKLDMGEWQKEAGKWAVGIFIILIITGLVTGSLPVISNVH
ncbi:CitMHS family transporter [Caproiciproducens faecalis]|uniref:Citrate transporter n=1 Tax=Caproiciproducens faecalis TaxID=2820301 RepID=A0ABS7DPE8_9FIRM|nr:citrate:proton symporter [Caproiciproducens faecalis]MBW7572976.1 citrate transporter [Caproiciproducens faecalis]